MYSEIPGGLIARTQVHSLIREQRSHKPLSMDKKKRVQMNQMNSQNRNRFIVIKNKHIANKVVGGINWEYGTPLQYSCLENPMDRGAWWAVVHGVAKSWTRLSNFPFTFHFHALEKEMATTHSSVLAWRIPRMGEPHGLPSRGLHRVRHG